MEGTKTHTQNWLIARRGLHPKHPHSTIQNTRAHTHKTRERLPPNQKPKQINNENRLYFGTNKQTMPTTKWMVTLSNNLFSLDLWESLDRVYDTTASWERTLEDDDDGGEGKHKQNHNITLAQWSRARGQNRAAVVVVMMIITLLRLLARLLWLFSSPSWSWSLHACSAQVAQARLNVASAAAAAVNKTIAQAIAAPQYIEPSRSLEPWCTHAWIHTEAEVLLKHFVECNRFERVAHRVLCVGCWSYNQPNQPTNRDTFLPSDHWRGGWLFPQYACNEPSV